MRREDVGDGSAAEMVVLLGSMVSGARKIRSPAPRTAGWMRRRYSSIKPVPTSDQANRALPWASRLFSTAITGFLTRNNDWHPARACPARFTRTGHAGGACSQRSLMLIPAAGPELNGIGSRPGTSSSRW